MKNKFLVGRIVKQHWNLWTQAKGVFVKAGKATKSVQQLVTERNEQSDGSKKVK